MTTTVTMLQTRQGEGGSLWTVGNSYAASDAFATVLINSNYATGTLPKSRGLVPVNAQTDSNGQITALVDKDGNSPVLIEGQSERPSSFARVVAPLRSAASSGTGDLSGTGAMIGPPSTYTTGFSTNAGWFTSATGASANQYAILPNRYLNGLTIGQDSWWVSFEMLMATPGSASNFFGFADTTSRYGFYWQAASGTGYLKPFLNTPAGYQAGLGLTTVAVADGTAKRIGFGMDRTGMLYLCINGEPVAQWQCGNLISDALVTANMAFGRFLDTNAAGTGVACQFRDVHVYTFPGKNLPLNMAALEKRIMAQPSIPIADAEILNMSAPIIAYTQAGQSWDQGAGPTPNKVLRLGPPMTDAIPPFGGAGAGSPHPAMIDEAGRRGSYLVVANTARGGTSIANHWCGRIYTWGAGARTAFGQYVIGSGNVFKATTVPSSTSGVTGGSEPSWPASGTVVDNQVTWTYVRAATASDTAGKIMQEGDDLFDPNGYVANLVLYNGRILNAARRHVDITFGQEDSTRSTSRADYALAHRYVTQYLLARGYTVTIGISAYVAAGDAWYTSDLIPGMTDALAYFAGNTSVKPGVNVRSLLGVMTASADQRPGILTLRSDDLHGNDECQLLVGKARAALVLA